MQRYKVYKITNTVNDKVYVGVTIHSLMKRFSTHKCHARKAIREDTFQGTILFKAINKHGIDKFSIHLIEAFDNEADMLKLEADLVKHYKALDLSYNTIAGGIMYCRPHTRSQSVQDASRERMLGNTQGRGYKHTPEAKAAISERNRTRVRMPKPPLDEVLLCKSSREVFEKFQMSRSEFYRIRKKHGII